MPKYAGGHSCSVDICRNTFTNAKNRGLSIRFHSFPKDAATRKAWIIKCCRKDEINPDTARICSEHFSEEDYEDVIKARVLGKTPEILKKSAVPSLLLATSKPQNILPTVKRLSIKERKEIINKLLSECEERKQSSTVPTKKGDKRTLGESADSEASTVTKKKMKRGGNICSVGVCHNSSYNSKSRGLALHFFSFPKDSARRHAWVVKCHRKDKFDPDSATICSEHFTEEDYENGLKAKISGEIPKKLKNTAIPSLCLHSSMTQKSRNQDTNTEKQHFLVEENIGHSDSISELGSIEYCPELTEMDQKIELDVSNLKCQLLLCQEEVSSLKTQLIICKESTKERIRCLERSNKELKNTIDLILKTSEAQFENKVKDLFKDFLTENQIEILLNRKTRAIWTEEEYTKANTLRWISKSAYIYVREHMNYPIPGLSSLRKWECERLRKKGPESKNISTVNVELCKEEDCVCGLCVVADEEVMASGIENS